MTLFPAGQDLLGKEVSEMVGEELCVFADGSVTGTFKKVIGYTQFSNKPEEQNGHYFPFRLTKTGKKMTLKKNGVAGEGKENMAFDPEIVLRIPQKNDKWTIEVDGAEVVTFHFEGATFE